MLQLVVLGVAIHGGGAQAQTVAAGQGFSCATTFEGRAVCWGENLYSQLGRGLDGAALALSPEAMPVVGFPVDAIVAEVSAAARSACALTGDGEVFCWGSNASGQLGDGTIAERPTAGQVTIAESSSALGLGDQHACAVTTQGAVYCWGRNAQGQTGSPASAAQPIPASVNIGGSAAADVTAGQAHSCAITTTGAVYCWGSDINGALGNGSATGSHQPQIVLSNETFVAVDAGGSATCAIADDGRVYCWGAGTSGQTGTGASFDLQTPQQPVIDSNGMPLVIEGIAVGGGHACAYDEFGVYCWGSNSHGQLGMTLATTMSNRAVSVAGLPAQAPSDISVGQVHSCAAYANGELYCWGSNLGGQLGNGQHGKLPSPETFAIAPDSGFTPTLVSAGFAHACARAAENGGEAYCWGDHRAGQLGDNLSAANGPLKPVAMPSGSRVQSIAAGFQHSCATADVSQGFLTSSELRCWGNGVLGQLGDGNTDDAMEPSAVVLSSSWPSSQTPVRVRSAVAGSSHSCAIAWDNADGRDTVRCWGDNTSRQLGIGVPGIYPSPQETLLPNPPSGARRVSAGWVHSCGLYVDHQVRCWGSQVLGLLGNEVESPDAVSQPQDVVIADGSPLQAFALSASGRHSCAIERDTGGVYCWGQGALLGNGNPLNATAATPVTGLEGGSLDTSATMITTSITHSCAVVANGETRCWGYNGNGELGSGAIGVGAVLAPVVVEGLSTPSSISAGNGFTCAIVAGNEMTCWGRNDHGQLGVAAARSEQPVSIGLISIAPEHQIIEEDENLISLTLVLQRTGDLSGPAEVALHLSDGTATFGSDYAAETPEVATFAANESTASVVVPIINDTIHEPGPPETVFVELQDPVGAGVAQAYSVIRISDNDPKPVALSVTAGAGCSAHEGSVEESRIARVLLYLSEALSSDTEVQWRLEEETATIAGGDLGNIAVQGAETIDAGQTSVELAIPVRGDAQPEADETFSVVVEGGSGSSSIAYEVSTQQGIVTCTIRNDDAVVSIAPSDGAVALENPPGQAETIRPARFLVALSSTLPAPLTLTYNVISTPGQQNDSDYIVPMAQELTIPAGADSGIIEISILADSVDEDDESFIVTLTEVTSGNGVVDVDDGSALGTIINDDDLLQTSFLVSALASAIRLEGDEGNADFGFRVTRTGTGAASVHVRVLDGTGSVAATLADGDFQPLTVDGKPLRLDFSDAGAQDVFVKVVGDSKFEPDENFRVELVDPSDGSVIAVAMAEGTILDDDEAKLFSDGFED